MALDPNDLIRAFEPILYFAPGERFFPSDCKRFLERASLWNAVAPFDDHHSWHAGGPGAFPKPVIFPGQLSGRSDEPGTFLGEVQGGATPYLYASGPDDGFLELAGWTDGLSVSPGSENRFANLDQIDALYNAPTPAADALLQNSRFWYHAEIFDAARLRVLMASQGAAPDLQALFTTLLDPVADGVPLLLCYYLFFPGHDEPLDDCSDVPEAAMFGSHAGSWASVSMLLRIRATGVPVGGGAPVTEEAIPVAIGVTARNYGDVAFLGDELRVGMRVWEWSRVSAVSVDRGPNKAKGTHARIFVAKGTHGLHIGTAPPAAGFPLEVPFAPDDDADRFCGAAELLDKSLDDLQDEADDAADDDWGDDAEVFWLKFFLFGFLWAGIEWKAAGGGGMDAVGSGTPEQFEHPPLRDAPGYFGAIIHPAGVAPPNGEGATTFAWQSALSNEAALEDTVDGRVYSLRVDRINPDPLIRQIWWPGIQGFVGFGGRWGQRVARDPKVRRAGMKFPEFWLLFMRAFAKSMAT